MVERQVTFYKTVHRHDRRQEADRARVIGQIVPAVSDRGGSLFVGRWNGYRAVPWDEVQVRFQTE